MNLYKFDRTKQEIDLLFEEYCATCTDIEALTQQIKTHKTELSRLKLFPPVSIDDREQYHQWRKKSFTLHFQRSDLKKHLLAVSEKINTLLLLDENEAA